MKLAAYTRVSTDRQAEKGFGLRVQQDQIARWAKSNGHTIVAWHTDEGVSGTLDLEHRLGLADALESVGKDRKARGLVVARLDRLARELVVQETIIGAVTRRKCRVFSCAAGEDLMLDDDGTDPSRKLIRQIMGAVSEYERSLLQARMAAGRARKKAEGGYAQGRPPYGYRASNGELVPVPAELEQIALMRTLRESGASYRNIAYILDRAEVPTPQGGKHWYENSVRRVLAGDEKRRAAKP